MSYFKAPLLRYMILSFGLALALIACTKEKEAGNGDGEDGKHPCYDASIVHDNPCTMDCPGITGCDGKTYCNECVAARQGIRPK